METPVGNDLSRLAGFGTQRLADVATRVLDLLVTMTGAAGGAVFAIGNRVTLWRAVDIDYRAIERVEVAAAHGLADSALVREDHAILPFVAEVAGAEVKPAFAFYLDRPRAVNSSKVSRLLSHLATCVSEEAGQSEETAHADVPAFSSPEVRARASFLERRRALLDLCAREEWNVSKVARVLRRSRVFVYRMLREHNIERPGGKRRCFGR